VLQHIDMAKIERLELQQLVDVSEPERELPVPERRDLLGDVRLEDPPAPFGLLECQIFVHLVLMVYFGVGRSRLLVHQVLWLDGFVDEVENPTMNREVQLHARVPATLRGRINRHGRLHRCLLRDLKSREAHPPIHTHLHRSSYSSSR